MLQKIGLLNSTLKRSFYIAVFSIIFIQISGCAAVGTSISKKDLDVQTKTSESIFLDPVSPEKRIVFVDVRNTSDKDLDIENEIFKTIKSRGFIITEDPTKANFMLQANVLKVGKSDLRDASGQLDAGFGGAIIGAELGSNNGSGNAALGLGLLGGIAGIAVDALVKDIMFVMITDLQVRERPLEGEEVTQSQKTNVTQGSSTSLSQNASGGTVKWKTYRTRIVSTANKVNLEFAEAQPKLVEGLIRSISGIF